MPSIQTTAITISLTGATASVLTCTSTAGLIAGMKGWAVKSDSTGNIEVLVSTVYDSTTFMCRLISAINNSGGSDLTLYNGGKIYFDTQIVESGESIPGGDIIDGTITDADIATANKDGTASTPSLRTLGTGATQAMPGNATLDAVADSATRKAVTAAGATAANALGTATVTSTTGTAGSAVVLAGTSTAWSLFGNASAAAGNMSALTVKDILSILLVRGADLGNADATIQPGTDKASLYVMPAATQTANRTTTLGVTSLWTQPRVYILDLGLTAYTHTIANGGTNAYNMTVLAASRTHPWLASFSHNGADWVPEGVLQVRP